MADEHQDHHDPTFYRSPADAAAAPPEKLAYLATFSRPADRPDALAVVDVDPQSPSYGAWDDQFYPGGVGAWMAKLDVNPDGGITFDARFFPEGEAFRGRRVHQVRLQGGDASSDSYCFPS